MTFLSLKLLWASLSTEVAYLSVTEETAFSLLENFVITSPGNNDLQVSIHSVQDFPTTSSSNL